MAGIVTKAEFAKMAGTSRQAVGQVARPGGRLADAVTSSGKINSKHPAAIEFIRAHTGQVPDVGPRDPAPSKASAIDLVSHDTDDLKDEKLRVDIQLQRLKIAEIERSLVPRDLVVSMLFGLIEEQNLRLLNDVPKNLARTVQAHGVSGISLEISEREIRDSIAKILEATKTKLAKKARSLAELD